MSEKEILEHLNSVIRLYRNDISTLKQEYEQKIQALEKDIQDEKQKSKKTQESIVEGAKNRLLQEKSKYEENFGRLKLSLDDTKKKLIERENQIQGLRDERAALQQNYRQLERAFDDSQRKVAELEKENRHLQQKTEKPLVQTVYEERSAGVKKASESGEWPSILDTFNRWAANPTPRILSGFSYAESEFRMRSKNDYQLSSSSGSKWIVNTRGDKKYLLPNPLAFNQLTNISELYHMDMSRLQPSNNKIKIVKPCELLDEGYINYPGELIIL